MIDKTVYVLSKLGNFSKSNFNLYLNLTSAYFGGGGGHYVDLLRYLKKRTNSLKDNYPTFFLIPEKGQIIQYIEPSKKRHKVVRVFLYEFPIFFDLIWQ